MKIVDVEAIPIKIPLKKPFTIAVGTITHTNHVLVRMTDDEGRVGWGESITFHAVYGYDQKSLYHVLKDHLTAVIKSLDPRDVASLHEKMDMAIPYNLMAKTGIDIAAYDLAAQEAGVPLHCLIGGKRVGRIPQIGVVDIVPPAAAADSAVEQVARGFKTIKIETVARAPGCPEKTFIVQFGAEPLSQEGNTMFGQASTDTTPASGSPHLQT